MPRKCRGSSASPNTSAPSRMALTGYQERDQQVRNPGRGQNAKVERGLVWIKWLGTHRDYDRIDVREVNHE
jgi:hypothetical protein